MRLKSLDELRLNAALVEAASFERLAQLCHFHLRDLRVRDARTVIWIGARLLHARQLLCEKLRIGGRKVEAGVRKIRRRSERDDGAAAREAGAKLAAERLQGAPRRPFVALDVIDVQLPADGEPVVGLDLKRVRRDWNLALDALGANLSKLVHRQRAPHGLSEHKLERRLRAKRA